MNTNETGKTTSAAIRYLYCYNFGTTNSKIAFLHKNKQGSVDNLDTLKGVKELLPKYLQLNERLMADGKVDKGKNNAGEIVNPFNNNSIKTFASATNRTRAASLLRGKTLVMMWYDEYAFLPFNDTIYMNAAPAYKTASEIAKNNGAPYGILITTTPGFMSTEEGKEAYAVKEAATKFSETWYDMTEKEMKDIINSNINSDFVYIKYSYQQLGRSETWFNDVCRLLKNSWIDIRREILLEWSTGVENSPFNPDDLDAISNLIRNPISEVYLLGKYKFDTYLQADTRTYPAIIGVDVAAGYKKDSSCITVVDSLTTKVLGCLNCNYIPAHDLAKCIEFIVKNWMPNAIINVERNGVGSPVVGMLCKMGLKRNLYYEIKDRTIEERQDGVHAYKHKVRVKEFGLHSTPAIRKLLIDILIERVENHKDKIISPIIYNELLGMEIKKNGKVEHSVSTHDDQTFSMLMALYVWYEGVNLAERYGIQKTAIKTDENIDEEIDYYNSDTVEIVGEFNEESELHEQIKQDLDNAIKSIGITYEEYIKQMRASENEQMTRLINTPLGEKAYRQMYNIPDNTPIGRYTNSATEFNIPDSVFSDFYNNNSSITNLSDPDFELNPNINAVSENQIGLLQNSGYNYREHFNF